MSAARIVICVAVCLAALLPPPARALDHTQLAVIINTWDPLSVEIGEYYAAQRSILFQNVIKVGFRPGRAALTSKEFGALKAWVDEKTVPGVEAYVLTWAVPYRVECMSITSAFAFGFDPGYCADTCKPTRPNRYFNSPSRMPFTQLGIRPTMAIAATSFEQAKALIDRGVESDGSFPAGTAYLLSTSDKARNVRSASYPLVEKMLRGRLRVRRQKWLRKFEQRYKWKLRAQCRTADGLARRSFQWSRNQHDAPAARILQYSRHG